MYLILSLDVPETVKFIGGSQQNNKPKVLATQKDRIVVIGLKRI